MRTIVHLSDLHFGRVDQALLQPLIEIVQSVSPHLVAISGDLTQRARAVQFRQARAFLDCLPAPQLVVPGNHDVPLYDVVARFTRPLARYRRYIASDLEPSFVDGEIAAFGVNTARSLTFKSGRINQAQIDRLRERLCAQPDKITKVVVTHHPFDLPPSRHPALLVGRAGLARPILAECGCDLLLAGHLHVGAAAEGSPRGGPACEPIVVQAGSATSTRRRGESNSFNVIDIESRRIAVRRYDWRPDAGIFERIGSESFERLAGGWRRAG